MMMQRTPQGPQAPAQQTGPNNTAPTAPPQAGGPQAPAGPQAPSKGPEPDNPVVEAFKTIGMWVAAQAENGNPSAPQMQDALRQLASAVMSKQPTQVAPGQAPQGQAPKAPAPMPQPGAQAPQGNKPGNNNVKPIPVM